MNNKKINVLDCTLRDGGIAIDFNFGTERMVQIKEVLENTQLEVIECGYIDANKGSDHLGKTCFKSEDAIREFLKKSKKKPGIKYVAMIDYGTFDPRLLNKRTEEDIDGIRLAFHKENWKEAIVEGKIILEKGYELFIQPMVSVRYTDEEFEALIKQCNKELPEAFGFYIVDSFGQMGRDEIIHKASLADSILLSHMVLGLHAHNNRQMAFANSLSFIEAVTNHDVMLDASIMGMGKGAGNLCTELIMRELNKEELLYHDECLYDIISNYFSEIVKTNHWGYGLDYLFSSFYSCTPSYISIFEKDERVTMDILVELLKNLPEKKRTACDRHFANQYLEEYFNKEK